MCLWCSGLDHLLPYTWPYYYILLRNVGTLADSPEHAALIVTKYWDKIDVWCESEQVQSARVYFVINMRELRNIRYGL